MWGDYYFDPKRKKIFKTQFHSKAKPMFVQFVLESLWRVYEAFNDKDTEKIQKIAKTLKIPLPDNFQDVLTKDLPTALNVNSPNLYYKTNQIKALYVEMVTN